MLHYKGCTLYIIRICAVVLFVGCVIDTYPTGLKSGCKAKYSCPKLAKAWKCRKTYWQAMPQCRGQIRQWWKTQVVRNHCKESCKNCRCKCTSFIVCALISWIILASWQYAHKNDLISPTLHLAVAIDCQWGRWSIGACTHSCGGGTQTKTRTVAVTETNGGKCVGSRTSTEQCNTLSCPSKCFISFFS